MKVKEKNATYSKLDRRRFRFCYLCVLFPVLQFCIFYVYINFNSIVLAFQDDFGNFTLHNFELVKEGLKQDPTGGGFGAMGRALTNSITLWVWSKVFIFPASIVSTYILFKKIPGHYTFRIIFMIPAIIGGSIWISTLQDVASAKGIIIRLCQTLDIDVPRKALENGLLGAPNTAFKTMVFFTVFGLVGGDVVLTGAFSRVPTEIFESARIDGAGFWRECVQIAIPCVGSTLTTILTFALCSILVADCDAFLYTNGSASEVEAETMGFYFLKMQAALVNSTSGRGYTYPAAVGMVISILTVPFVLIGRWALDKLFPPIEF